MTTDKSCFLLSAIRHPDLSVAREQVESSEHCASLQVIEDLFYLWQWPAVGLHLSSHGAVVNAEPTFAVFLCYNDNRK